MILRALLVELELGVELLGDFAAEQVPFQPCATRVQVLLETS